MEDQDKTKKQLINELVDIRGRVAELEALETQRKHVEKGLLETERGFRAILDHTFQLIGLLATDGSYIAINSPAMSFFGIKESEALGHPIWEFPGSNHTPEFQQQLRNAVQTAAKGQFCRFEAYHPGQNGSVRYIDSSIKPVKDEAGKVVFLIIEGRDITDRRRAEEALRESTEMLNATLAASPIGIALVRKRDLQWANKAMYQMLGYEKHNLMDKSSSALYPNAEEYERVDRVLKNGLKDSGFAQVDTKWIRKDGTIIACNIRVQSLDPDDPSKGIIMAVMDITEREQHQQALQKAHDELEQRVEERTLDLVKANEQLMPEIKEREQAELKLQQSEERYRTLVENMNDGLTVQNEKGEVVYTNDRFSKMIGFSKDEITGRTFSSFLDKTNQSIARKQMALRKKGTMKPYELKWKRKDGKKIHTIVSPQILFDSKRNHSGSATVITDITRLIQTQKKLQQREKELLTQQENLEETNVALRVLLRKRNQDRQEVEKEVLSNINELVLPTLLKLKKKLNGKESAIANILESNLNDVISPFSRRLSLQYLYLTPTEMQVANLIKQGITTKEIADFMNLSPRTIEDHRKSIRRKLGIKKTKINLRTQLLSVQE